MGRSAESKKKQREINKKYQLEVRNLCKIRKICVMCRKEKAVNGKTMCLNCLDYSKNEGEWSRSDNSKQQRREYIKRKRDLCVAFGICRECMCREASEGLKCAKCKSKERIKNEKKSKRLLYISMGKCTLCGGDRVDGYKVCSRCLEKCRSIAVNRCKADNSNHYWRKIQSGEVRRIKAFNKI